MSLKPQQTATTNLNQEDHNKESNHNFSKTTILKRKIIILCKYILAETYRNTQDYFDRKSHDIWIMRLNQPCLGPENVL